MGAGYIKAAELGRPLAHIIFSAMFVYDIVANNSSFGWDNAGIYAVGTFGGEAILAFAKIRFGVSESSADRVSSESVNPIDAESKPVAKRQPRTRQGARGNRAY